MPGCVGKVLKILTAVSEGKNKPVSLAEISEATGLPKSTCARILSEMMYEGYVDQVSRQKGYKLGPAAYCLSRYGKYNSELVEICHPILKWLHNKTDLCVGLAVIQNGRIFVIDCINTEPKTVTQEGEIYPEDVYYTPAGRIILANMSETQLREIYEKNGISMKKEWNDGIVPYDTLKGWLAEIDKKGVLEFGEPLVEGQVKWGGYGVAIYRYSSCVGALIISVNDDNGTMEKAKANEEEIKRLMIKGRNEISRRLTYE